MGTSICRHVYRQAFKMGFRYRLFKKVKNNQIVGDRIRNADLCDQKPPLSANIFTASVTRLGDFLEIIDKYFFQKLPKCLVVFWALLKTSLFNSNCCGYFLVSFDKIWTTFYSNIWSHWSQPLIYLRGQPHPKPNLPFIFVFQQLSKLRIITISIALSLSQ